jgi:hypothetical protein
LSGGNEAADTGDGIVYLYDYRDEDRDLVMDRDDYDDEDPGFADPGGRSALRAASRKNPRNIACPQCDRPNMLTPADRARHYVCDICADQNEGGGY